MINRQTFWAPCFQSTPKPTSLFLSYVYVTNRRWSVGGVNWNRHPKEEP